MDKALSDGFSFHDPYRQTIKINMPTKCLEMTALLIYRGWQTVSKLSAYCNF